MASGSTYVFPLIYSYLAYPDENGNFVPDLAESWSSEENGKVWRFFLRTDARFHNGKPVTAMDVARSLAQLISKRFPNLDQQIERIQAHDNVLSPFIYKSRTHLF